MLYTLQCTKVEKTMLPLSSVRCKAVRAISGMHVQEPIQLPANGKADQLRFTSRNAQHDPHRECPRPMICALRFNDVLSKMADGYLTGWSRGTRESSKSTGKTALLRPPIGINAAKCTTGRRQAVCQERTALQCIGMHSMYQVFARGNCQAVTGAGIIRRCDGRRLTSNSTD